MNFVHYASVDQALDRINCVYKKTGSIIIGILINNKKSSQNSGCGFKIQYFINSKFFVILVKIFLTDQIENII